MSGPCGSCPGVGRAGKPLSVKAAVVAHVCPRKGLEMPRRRDKHFLDATCGGVSGKDRLIPDGQLSNTDAAPGSGGPGPACLETLVFSRPGSPQFSGPGPTPREWILHG